MATLGRLVVVFAFVVCALFSPALASPLSEDEQNRLLSSAESLFLAMKARHYGDIWSLLTEATKKAIVSAVDRESKRTGAARDRQTIEADFEKGGTMARAYWDGYLSVFKPDRVLEESEWRIGTVKKDRAEISIRYRKSEKPALLQLHREQNSWKVGLEETFGPRNMMPF